MIDEMIGETVWLWPSDSMRKEATLLAVDELGLYFKITNDPKPVGGTFGCSTPYRKGQTIFISRASKLSWILLTRDEVVSE